MEDIIMKLQALKDDKPHLIITEDIIKSYIEDNMELLIKEIKKEI